MGFNRRKMEDQRRQKRFDCDCCKVLLREHSSKVAKLSGFCQLKTKMIKNQVGLSHFTLIRNDISALTREVVMEWLVL